MNAPLQLIARYNDGNKIIIIQVEEGALQYGVINDSVKTYYNRNYEYLAELDAGENRVAKRIVDAGIALKPLLLEYLASKSVEKFREIGKRLNEF